jgi:hypothetical protein
LVALAIFMRLSLTKAAHVAMSSAAWQEIRVRSGRDDNSVMGLVSVFPGETTTASAQQNCHLDRRSHGPVAHSEAALHESAALSFVISTEAYPDFLPRFTEQGHVCAFL